jgi:hypothetical protein
VSHAETGGESPSLVSARAMFDGRQGLSAESPPFASAWPTAQPSADPIARFDRHRLPAREARAVGEPVGSLLGHAEELDDLDDADGEWPSASRPFSSADRLQQHRTC